MGKDLAERSVIALVSSTANKVYLTDGPVYIAALAASYDVKRIHSRISDSYPKNAPVLAERSRT